jgi:hypothetical protein
MHQQPAAVLFALVLVLEPSMRRPPEKPVRATDMPHEFRGQFAWGQQDNPYTLILTIERITGKDGIITFWGRHHYTPGDYTMKVEGTIDARSRRIRIRESQPSHPNADTDGSFNGTISEDLRTIDAGWTGSSPDKKGALKLHARRN